MKSLLVHSLVARRSFVLDFPADPVLAAVDQLLLEDDDDAVSGVRRHLWAMLVHGLNLNRSITNKSTLYSALGHP